MKPITSPPTPRIGWRTVVYALACLTFVCFSSPAMAGEVEEAKALIERVLPQQANQFSCRLIPAEGGKDVFEIEAAQNGIVIRGNSGVSLAMGFNWYLRQIAHTNYDWQATGPLQLAGALPKPQAKIHRACVAQERFFLNYCTFGYTFPFTSWEGWQRFIDWMAMNGINRPLLQTGQEAVWLRVWKSYGLSDAQILAYFSGPAHLAWHRMANLDGWGGPLPMSYLDGQMKLQKQILARARALGMKPILSGFAGHVPQALKQSRPDAKISGIKPGWGGMEAKYATWFLDPTDPLFTEIQQRFLKEQTALYGTDHLYAADPFNEISPPSWEPAYMASVGKRIYDGMASADPAAVWYQMSWTFDFEKHWQKPTPSGETPLSAMIKAVPTGRMILLDYVCEEKELYKKTQSFYGAPFIWNYLANFGGCTYMIAPTETIASGIAGAVQQPNWIGVGSTLEGLGINPEGYDLTLEAPWYPNGKVDPKAWLAGYATRRAGRPDAHVIKAWAILSEKVLQRPRGHFDRGSAMSERPGKGMQKEAPAAKTALEGVVPARDPKMVAAYAEAIAELLQAAPASQAQDGYRFDAVNWVRQVLAYHSDNTKVRMLAAYRNADIAQFRKERDKFLDLIRDMDRLLATRHEYLLGTWIRDARAWGATKAEADYYEANAREILTSWHRPGGGLDGYARREWSGLLAGYYLPRWEAFTRELEKGIEAGQAYDAKAYQQWLNDFDKRWIHEPGKNLVTTPQGDAVTIARQLFEKYRTELSAPAPTR